MGSMVRQTNLFSDSDSSAFPQMPEGFRYRAEIISEEEQAALVAVLQTLNLKPFEFHGHLGNRRVASFGFRYDYDRPGNRNGGRTSTLSRGFAQEGRRIRWVCTGRLSPIWDK
jgi:hypothetical protein